MDADIIEAETNLPVEAQAKTSALSLVRPVATPAEILESQNAVHKIIQEALTPDKDYGVIPGTGTKPTLYKPGAERINLAFGATPRYEIIEKEVDHNREIHWQKKKKIWNNAFKGDKSYTWGLEDGLSVGAYRYVIRCTIMQGERVLADGIASASTYESKYIDRPRDCENTVLKMAEKRAYVGATLNAYALSDRFTQDIEDNPNLYEREPPPPKAKPAKKAEPKSAPVTKEPSKYTGDESQQKMLQRMLLKHTNLPEALFGEFHDKMLNRPSNEWRVVVGELGFDVRK